MASFTMPFWQYAKFRGGEFKIVNGVAVCEGGEIGLEHYPIFNEEYRSRLNGVIIDHFWNQEIGQESTDMFHHSLRRKLNLIMPSYNQLYENTLIKWDPMNTVDIQTLTTGDMSSISNALVESENDGTAKSDSGATEYSMPQNELHDDGNYATSASKGDSTSSSKNLGKESNKQDQTQNQKGTSRTTGHSSSPIQSILAARSAILNVEQLILADMADLFMRVWDSQDSYAPDPIGYIF